MGNFAPRLWRHQQINPLTGMTIRRLPDGRIDARVRPEIKRIIISRQFKFPPRLIIIGQSQITPSHSKLQVSEPRINLGGLLIEGKRLPIRTCRFLTNAFSHKTVPSRFLVCIQTQPHELKQTERNPSIDRHRA